MITFFKYKGWFENRLSPNITSFGNTNGPILKGRFVLHEQIATYKLREIIKVILLRGNVAS